MPTLQEWGELPQRDRDERIRCALGDIKGLQPAKPTPRGLKADLELLFPEILAAHDRGCSWRAIVQALAANDVAIVRPETLSQWARRWRKQQQAPSKAAATNGKGGGAVSLKRG